MIALLREISRVCAEQQLKAPTYRTVRRRLGALDPEVVTRSRLDVQTAQELFQPVQRGHLHHCVHSAPAHPGLE
jgi:hypothetical protein